MNALGLVLTIVVLLFVALLILLFERKRATGIERDLKKMSREQREHPQARLLPSLELRSQQQQRSARGDADGEPQHLFPKLGILP